MAQNAIRQACWRGMLASLVVAFTGHVYAGSTAEERTAQALGRAQVLLREAAADKSALNEELIASRASNLALKSTNAALESRLGTVIGSEAALSARCRTAVSFRVQVEGRQRELTRKLRQITHQYKAMQQQLEAGAVREESLASDLSAARAALGDAEKKNIALFDKNRELVGLIRQRHGLTGLFVNEPFTGLARVRIEKLLEQIEYESFELVIERNLAAVRGPD